MPTPFAHACARAPARPAAHRAAAADSDSSTAPHPASQSPASAGSQGSDPSSAPAASPSAAAAQPAQPRAPRVVLHAGEVLFERGSAQGVWRVVSGVIRLDQPHSGRRMLVQLALPGDLVGFEALLGRAHSFEASALVGAVLQPLKPGDAAQRQAWVVEALLQQPERSHDMARMRTGAVADRLAELLRLLGAMPLPGFVQSSAIDPDALRNRLPPLRELAEVVDAKPETVCRALAQLLPPRTRKGGPKPAARRVSLGTPAAALQPGAC